MKVIPPPPLLVPAVKVKLRLAKSVWLFKGGCVGTKIKGEELSRKIKRFTFS